MAHELCSGCDEPVEDCVCADLCPNCGELEDDCVCNLSDELSDEDAETEDTPL